MRAYYSLIIMIVNFGYSQAVIADTGNGEIIPETKIDPKQCPELTKHISGHFFQPSMQDMINLLNIQSGLTFRLDPKVISDRPIAGTTKFEKIPIWGLMIQMAKNKYVLGYWRKIDNVYVLYANYNGPPPAIPPPVPQPIQDIILSNNPSDQTNRTIQRQRRWLYIIGGLSLLGTVALVYRWRSRRSQLDGATSATT